MFPTYTVFGKELASYGTLILIGFAVATLLACYLAKRSNFATEDVFYSLLYAVIGIAVGGKLLFFITVLPSIWPHVPSGDRLGLIQTLLLQGGFVFYGSLLGGALALLAYCKQFKVSFERIIYCIAPTIPVMQAFGRLGCFAAGCCHGIESQTHGIAYTCSPAAPNGVPFFPVQLVESVACVVIAAILLATWRKLKSGFNVLHLYVLLYAPVRFGLEFYRGDAVRGGFLSLSTSQWISIILVIAVILSLSVSRKRRKEEVQS